MAVTLKSPVRLGDGTVVTVADGLASGALVKTRYWDIQFDRNHGSMIHNRPAWEFDSRCPQHRDVNAARHRLDIYRSNKCGKTRMVYRDFIDRPDGCQYGQIGKTVVVED